MGDVFKVDIDVKGTNFTLMVNTDWNYSTLYENVSHQVKKDVDCFSLYLPNGLKLDRNLPFKSMWLYGLGDSARLTYKYALKPFAQYVKPSDEPCCLAIYDDDPLEPRIEMPCHCIISFEGLGDQCQQILSSGGPTIQCPKCLSKWDFFVVRHVLQSCKTPERLSAMSDQLNRNFVLQDSSDIRKCPGCSTYSTRDLTQPWANNASRVSCNVCRKKTRKVFEFCWQCSRKWISGNNDGCGNKNCDGHLRALEILATCDVLKEPHYMVGCPKIRACARCGVLIEWAGACKHMVCRSCKTEFCLLCLSIKPTDAVWSRQQSCYNAFSKCPLAPRQTKLPDIRNPPPAV